MKKHLFCWSLMLFSFLTFGQKEVQIGNPVPAPLIPTSKVSLLKNVDVIFNTRFAFDNYFVDGNHTNSLYSINQFRFEVKGKIHDKVSFRFRNRYTKIADPSTIDNMSRAVDFAIVSIDVAPQMKLTVGKMIGDWGGYELLTNPIEILSYNTINDKADNFLVGAAFSYALLDHKNSFNIQVLNSRTKTFLEQYGTTSPPEITPNESPLVVVGNWKGHLFNNKLETTYSYSYFNDAKNANVNYVALGNKFKANKFVLYYDFQYSKEELDHKGVVSAIVKSKNTYAAENVSYVENWIRGEYMIRPKLNLLLTIMNSNAYWAGNPDPNKSNNLVTSYGIIPTVEFSPFSDLNMKFYMGFIAKKNNYSAYAHDNFNAVDGTTGQLSFGIIAPLLVL